MAETILISGGRVIDPSRGIDAVGDILIADGRIIGASTGIAAISAKSDLVIDAKGMVVCPGFIDLHCHLREPGGAKKETIATGTRAAAKGGFTTVCAMPNTNPPIDSAAMVELVYQKAAKSGVVRVLPIGCITKKRAGLDIVDMKEMADAGVVALSDDGSSVPEYKVLRAALEASVAYGLTIIEHCEDAELSAGGVMNEGDLSARLGLKGIPETAEDIVVARDLALSEMTGAHVHIAHVSTYGSIYLIRRARASKYAVTAEVTPHHLTMGEDRVGTMMGGIKLNANAKVNPPLRRWRDIQALVAALQDGIIDAIATDHAPHTKADKSGDFTSAAFGISGLETAFGSVMSLVHRGEIGLSTLIAKLTMGPVLALPRIRELAGGEIGTMKVGALADVTIFDPDATWVVDPAQFVSKGKNTPLGGELLKGKVMATIYGGRIVYKEDGLIVKGM
jgi:dihydroorotase